MPIRGMTLTNRTTSSLAAAVIGLMVVLGPVPGTSGAAAGPLSAEDADALKAALKAVDDNGRQRAVLHNGCNGCISTGCCVGAFARVATSSPCGRICDIASGCWTMPAHTYSTCRRH